MSYVKIATRVSAAFTTCVLIAIFISSVSADDAFTCCKCRDDTWQSWIQDGGCGDYLGYTGACKDHLGFMARKYQKAAVTTCGQDCSNKDSNCGRPNLGYVWSRGTRCDDDWLCDDVYKCTQDEFLKCTQSKRDCKRNEECLPKHEDAGGPADGGACKACVACIPNGAPCVDATCCCEAVDPDCCSVCVDKDSDPNNCGECGNACGANAYCSGGTCHCNEGYQNCDDDWSNGCECPGECCLEGTPNAGTCYTPETPEDGCCQYGEECYDGNRDPEECRVCYGGTWYPGWHCEEGKCIPEFATIAIPVAAVLGLVFLFSRRKQKR